MPPSKRRRAAPLASPPSISSTVSHYIDGPISHPLTTVVASVSSLDGSLIFQGRRYTLAALHPSTHPILRLQPVRSVLHPFLTDKDAARLLRAGRTTVLALLPGFTFTQHVFVGKSQQQMLRMRALYEAYDMRPTRMCLLEELQSLSFEESSGRSPFPSSLRSLSLGPMTESNDIDELGLFDHSSLIEQLVLCPSALLQSDPLLDFCYVKVLDISRLSPMAPLRSVDGSFDCSLPPGLLPHGLCRLQISRAFGSPLLPGSIPSTVEVLDAEVFNQPLLVAGVSVLPSSLARLSMENFQQPLLPGVLPSSLHRLTMTMWNQPLEMNVLPSSLRALHLESFDHPLLPGALPTGLTHLGFTCFTKPLEVGVLPTSLISFDLGCQFKQPLRPGQQQGRMTLARRLSLAVPTLTVSSPLSLSPLSGVLPPSLRIFWHSRHTRHPLGRGVLPEGLAVLHWNATRANVDIQPGVLPTSLRALKVDLARAQRIVLGSIPDGLKALKLNVDCWQREDEMGLPAGCVLRRT